MEKFSFLREINGTLRSGNACDQAVPAFADFVPTVIVVDVDDAVVAHKGRFIGVADKVIDAAFELKESGVIQSGIGT